MDNDYLDSPSSLITLITLMNEEKIFDEKLIAHDNSDNFIPTKLKETTSYFTIIYYLRFF